MIHPTYQHASLLSNRLARVPNDEDSNYRHRASRGEKGLDCEWIMLYKTTRVSDCQPARINSKVESTPDRVVCDRADKVSAEGYTS